MCLPFFVYQNQAERNSSISLEGMDSDDDQVNKHNYRQEELKYDILMLAGSANQKCMMQIKTSALCEVLCVCISPPPLIHFMV